MEKKEESKLRISEYLHSLRISGGYKTLREWCRLNDFSDVLWSHLENNLWEIVPIGKRIYTQTELDKAREEGIKMGMENAWGMVSSLLDTLDIDKNEEEIKVLVGVNKLFDTEITKLALNLKTKEDGK